MFQTNAQGGVYMSLGYAVGILIYLALGIVQSFFITEKNEKVTKTVRRKRARLFSLCAAGQIAVLGCMMILNT